MADDLMKPINGIKSLVDGHDPRSRMKSKEKEGEAKI